MHCRKLTTVGRVSEEKMVGQGENCLKVYSMFCRNSKAFKIGLHMTVGDLYIDVYSIISQQVFSFDIQRMSGWKL